WSFSGGNGYSVARVLGPEVDLATDWLDDPEKIDRPFFRSFLTGEGSIFANFGGVDSENNDWLVFDELGGTAGDLTGNEPGPGGTITVMHRLVTYVIDVEGLTGRVRV